MDGDIESEAPIDEYPAPDTAAGAPAAPRQESAESRGERFDPTPYMRQLRGRGGSGEYLDIKWRLLWLRKEHPDAQIVTEHVQIEPTLAIFKATVSLPSGGKATGYGSETAGDFGDFIEKAETKSIGRALNALGYGAQFNERGDEDLVASPRVAPRPTSKLTPLPERGSRSASQAVPTPMPDRSSSASAPTRRKHDQDRPQPPASDLEASSSPSIASAAAVVALLAADVALDASRDVLAVPANPDDDRRAAAERGDGAAEPDLADYSWTAFWPWARGLGLNGPQAVEELIGRATAGLSPAQLRELILAARGVG